MKPSLVFVFGWIFSLSALCWLYRDSLHPFMQTKHAVAPIVRDRLRGMDGFFPANILLIGFLYSLLIWSIVNFVPASEQLLAIIWLTSGYWLSVTDIIDYSVPGLVLYPGHIILAAWHLWHGQPIQWLSLLFVVPLIGFVWRQTMGGGDVLLLLGWAPWLHVRELALLLLLASFLGMLVFGCSRLLWRKKLIHLPFVPFLSLSLYLVCFGYF